MIFQTSKMISEPVWIFHLLPSVLIYLKSIKILYVWANDEQFFDFDKGRLTVFLHPITQKLSLSLPPSPSFSHALRFASAKIEINIMNRNSSKTVCHYCVRFVARLRPALPIHYPFAYELVGFNNLSGITSVVFYI